METDKYRMLLTQELIIKNPECNIEWVTADGKRFKDKYEAERHDRIVSRQMYYEHLMKNRNWFQRVLNLKPNMNFYDELCSKIN